MDKVFETVPIQKAYLPRRASEWAKSNGLIIEDSFEDFLDNLNSEDSLEVQNEEINNL